MEGLGLGQRLPVALLIDIRNPDTPPGGVAA